MLQKGQDGIRRLLTRAGHPLILVALASAAVALPAAPANAIPPGDGGYGSLKTDHIEIGAAHDRWECSGDAGCGPRTYQWWEYTSGPKSGQTCWGFIRLMDGGTQRTDIKCN